MIKKRSVVLILGYLLVAVFISLFFFQDRPSITGASVAELYDISYYYTPLESESPIWTTTSIPNIGSTAACKEKNKGFYEDVKCQGSGITIDNRICIAKTIKTTKEDSEVFCKLPGVDNLGTRGITEAGTNPTAHRTIATDYNVIPKGTEVNIFFGEGNPWNGCYVAEDIGSMIKQKHIDVYAGVGNAALKEAMKYIKENAMVTIGCGGIAPKETQEETVEEVSKQKGEEKQEPKEEKIPMYKSTPIIGAELGRYYIKPQFTVSSNTDIQIYSNIASIVQQQLISNVANCESNGAPLNSCIKNEVALLSGSTGNQWSIDCSSENDKVLENFMDMVISCYRSKTTNCKCKNEDILGSYLLSKNGDGMIIEANINGEEKIARAEVLFTEESSQFSMLYKTEEGSLSTKGEGITTNCDMIEKRIYKFCVTTDKEIVAYDEYDKTASKRKIVVNFAIDFPMNEKSNP